MGKVSDIVLKEFTLPFTLHDYQDEAVDDLVEDTESGEWMDVGVGKTVCSTVLALYHSIVNDIEQVVVIMPPILLVQWSRWLDSIPEIDHVMYRGTPAERKEIDLEVGFILMSIQIFKNDFTYLNKYFARKNVFVIMDEADAIRNVTTQNHRRFKEFTLGRPFTLLTGTTISNPGHCYGYIRLLSPKIYRSKAQFEAIHVVSRDFWGQVEGWHNLDILAEAMMAKAVRIKAEDVLELPPVTYDPVFYELKPKHARLYKKLAEERILALEDGQVIDATIAQSLYNHLQKIVVCPNEFGLDEKPAGYELVDELLKELGDDKLVIFANHRVVNRQITAYLEKDFGAVACFGEVSRTQQEKNLYAFLEDPACKVLVGSPKSIGKGLNLQSVCRCVLFLQLPITSDDFKQACGRVIRDGQVRNVIIKIATAVGTIQMYLQSRFFDKDDIIQQIMPDNNTLRELIMGGL